MKELNNFLSELIENKDLDKCIKLLNGLDYKFISHIKKEVFHSLIKELPFSKIEQIKNALKCFPDEINSILNDFEKKNNFKEGIKLIKLLNLEWKDYDKAWDRYSIRIFYNYKIQECLEDKFDILLDYALISETLYNELINKLLNKIKKTKHDSAKKGKENMNSLNLKVVEFEYPGNDLMSTNLRNSKNNANELSYLDFDMMNKMDSFNEGFYPDYMTEQEDSEDDDCRIILKNFQNVSNDKLKEKTSILFKQGREKKFLLTKANKQLFDNVFNYKLPKLNINNYICEDKFAPHDNSCFQLDLKKVHVSFVDTISKLSEQYLKYFQHTKIIGVDSEWKQQFYARSREFCSIIQMANFEERNVIIIDMLKLTKEKEFAEIFTKYFSNKTFIGYSFDASDLDHFSNGIQNAFKKANIIDLIDLYQYKYLNKAQGLKNLCKEILGINICKYEQCSFWENRPLKQSQLHYAAVDAFICVSLYKKLVNNC
jgi:DNA polymerase III epsilon subunit-like protein